MIRTGILTIALAIGGLAQIRVPVAGYVADAAHQLRPIVGSPGAALLGSTLSSVDSGSGVSISPDQRYAIVSGDRVSIAPIGPDGLGALTPVQGTTGNPDRIVFSAASSSAALYSAQSNRIQIVTGLPANPQMTREFTVAGDLLAFALSTDAGSLLIAGSEGNVSLLTADGTARLVSSGGSVVALQFLPDASRAIAIDSARNQVLLIGGLPDAPATQVIADAQAGLDSPRAVQVIAAGHRVLVANSGGGNILNINLESGDTASIACNCRPAILQQLMNGAFLIAEEDRNNVWMLDAAASRVLFVPAVAQ